MKKKKASFAFQMDLEIFLKYNFSDITRDADLNYRKKKKEWT